MCSSYCYQYDLLIPEPNAKFEGTKELTFMKTLHETTGQNIFKEAEKMNTISPGFPTLGLIAKLNACQLCCLNMNSTRKSIFFIYSFNLLIRLSSQYFSPF